MRTHGRFLSAAAIMATCALGACDHGTKGVEVYNETDEILRAEMISVNAVGESSVYSTAIINRGGTFSNRMVESVRGQSMRVRFTLAEQPPGETNWNGSVLLSLPEKSVRVYSLRFEVGRLRADEYKRSRP